MNKMNKFLKSVLKTAVYLLDQSDRVADRVDEVSDRVSDLRHRARDLYGHEDHTMRNIMTFAAGVGVGIGAGMLLAPTSGEDIRNSIGEKVHDIGDRVRTRFSSEANRATGTKGV
ncbi:MAG: hypothetical protein DMG76_08115 [Acidobacteria bacterium]|jgi:hypothetical protein|nr:MAG: hypothetical protein DMG76_08115 [Acidobacteriota bacterium]